MGRVYRVLPLFHGNCLSTTAPMALFKAPEAERTSLARDLYYQPETEH